MAGRWRGRRIEAPPGPRVRPTTDRVREAWMSALQGALPGARVVDLFAGSGALGLEALSRGAEHVVFVERAGPSLRALRANLDRHGAEAQATVVADDVLRWLDRDPEPCDLAFADPPYGGGEAARLVGRFLERPFATELWLEHAWRDREALGLPPEVRTRRYGDTALTALTTPEPDA